MEKMNYLDDLLLFVKKFEKFELNYPKNSNKIDYNFEKLVTKLMNKDMIKLMDNLLNTVYNYLSYCNISDKDLLLENRINSREFLSSYMINFNHEEVLDNNTGLKEELIYKTKTVLESFENIRKFFNNNKHLDSSFDDLCYSFCYNCYKFKLHFTYFKSKDKKDLLNVLLQSQFELKMTLDMLIKKKEDNKLKDGEEEWLEHIPHHIEKVVDKIKKLEPNNFQDLIDNFVPIMAEDQSQQDLLKVAQKAYFDVLREEMNSNNFKKFYVAIQEIKNMLKSFTPSRNDLLNELDESLDNSLIKSVLDDNINNLINLKDLLFYIVGKISSLESPLEDRDTELWTQNLKEEFNNYENIDDKNNYLINIFLNFIEKSHQKMNKILTSLQNIGKQENL